MSQVSTEVAVTRSQNRMSIVTVEEICSGCQAAQVPVGCLLFTDEPPTPPDLRMCDLGWNLLCACLSSPHLVPREFRRK